MGVAQKAEVILGDRLINCVHSLTEEQIPVSFRALLTLNTFAFDGITVTDVTEVHESGPLSEKDEILNPYLEQNYLLSEYHVDFRMTAVWHVSFDTLLRPAHDGYDAYGNAFVITGRQEPYSDLDTIATIAYELEIASLYDSLGSPPSPNVFLPPATTSTSLESSFSSSNWDEIGRVSYGNRGLPSPPTSSSADFIDGVVPSASWNEYWFQAEEVLPTGGVETKKTFILHAKQTDKNGEVTEGYGTVTFAIREGKEISDAQPVVEGLESPFTSWVEAKADGTLLVKPPVERGKRNVVSVLAVEVKVEGVEEEDEESDKNIVIINADNDNGSAWKADTMDTIPTTRDFEHGGGFPKDDEELKLVEVTAPDMDGIEVKIKISPSDKVKAWKNRDKTDQIAIGGDGALSFPNDEITDFYTEGIKVSDAKGEISLTMEVKVGQQNQVADTIKFAVGPILENMEVDPSDAENFRKIISTVGNSPYVNFQCGTTGKKGMTVTSTVDMSSVVEANVKFVQLVLESTRDIYHSKEGPTDKVKAFEIPTSGQGWSFLVLDGSSGNGVFYTVGGSSHNKKQFWLNDSPLTVPLVTAFKQTGDGSYALVDTFVWKDVFRTYTVIEFADGSIYSLGSLEWIIDATASSTYQNDNGDGAEQFEERVLEFESSSKADLHKAFERANGTPTKLKEPYANDVLKLKPAGD